MRTGSRGVSTLLHVCETAANRASRQVSLNRVVDDSRRLTYSRRVARLEKRENTSSSKRSVRIGALNDF